MTPPTRAPQQFQHTQVGAVELKGSCRSRSNCKRSYLLYVRVHSFVMARIS